MKQILLSVTGVVLGIVVGMIAMMCLHMASALVYPLPEGADFMDSSPENQERLQEWFRTLPAGAFLLATLSHGLGCMSGAFVAMFVSGRRTLVAPVIVGVFFTLGGIMNLSSVPHPAWFPIVDLPVYLVLAVIAGRMLKRPDDGSSAAGEAPPADASPE